MVSIISIEKFISPITSIWCVRMYCNVHVHVRVRMYLKQSYVVLGQNISVLMLAVSVHNILHTCTCISLNFKCYTKNF